MEASNASVAFRTPGIGNALTPELRKRGNGLGVLVKNEYRCVEYPAQRIEGVDVCRLGEAERRDGCLDPRRWVAQQIQILHCAGRVADRQLDTMAREYLSVSLGNIVVPGSCRSRCDYEARRWQRINQAIGHVQSYKDDRGRRNQNG
jgi:hypothetical protein